MVKYNDQSLDSTFAALSDPTRRAILAKLVHGECTMTDLAAPFDVTLPAVLKHLRVLEEAGLVRRQKYGRSAWFELNAEPLKAATDWMSRYEQFWQGQFDALANYLEQSSSKEEAPCPPSKAIPPAPSTSRVASAPPRKKSSVLGRTRKR